MSAETLLYSTLSGAAAVTAIVSTRIYPDVVPQDATLPCVAFNRIDTVYHTTIHSAVPVAETAILEITCMAGTRVNADALADAQSRGFAEADPAFDVEGVDAAHKATLMSAIAFGVPVQFDKAHVEGITKLSAVDIRYAEQLGYRIKLLGIAKRRDGARQRHDLRQRGSQRVVHDHACEFDDAGADILLCGAWLVITETSASRLSAGCSQKARIPDGRRPAAPHYPPNRPVSVATPRTCPVVAVTRSSMVNPGVSAGVVSSAYAVTV